MKYFSLSFVLLLMMSGCVSVEKFGVADFSVPKIQNVLIGQTVVIETKRMEKHLIKIEFFDNEKIIGSGKTFLLDEVVSIKKEDISPMKTVGAIATSYVGFSVAIISLSFLAFFLAF